MLNLTWINWTSYTRKHPSTKRDPVAQNENISKLAVSGVSALGFETMGMTVTLDTVAFLKAIA